MTPLPSIDAARFWTVRQTGASEDRMRSTERSAAAQDTGEEAPNPPSPAPQIRPRIYPGL